MTIEDVDDARFLSTIPNAEYKLEYGPFEFYILYVYSLNYHFIPLD